MTTFVTLPSVPDEPSIAPVSRAAQNRKNAERSCGPNTTEGKQRTSQNARKHGLFSHSLFVPPSQQAGYASLLVLIMERFGEHADLYRDELARLRDAEWQLDHVAEMERDILNKAIAERLDDYAELAGNPDEQFRLARVDAIEAKLGVLARLMRYEKRLAKQVVDLRAYIERLKNGHDLACRQEEEAEARRAQAQAQTQTQTAPQAQAQTAPQAQITPQAQPKPAPTLTPAANVTEQSQPAPTNKIWTPLAQLDMPHGSPNHDR